MTTYRGHQDSETGSEDIALNYWWQARGLGKQNFTQASGRHKSGNPDHSPRHFITLMEHFTTHYKRLHIGVGH